MNRIVLVEKNQAIFYVAKVELDYYANNVMYKLK